MKKKRSSSAEAEEDEEEEIANSGLDIASDIYVINHHGSADSSGFYFLNKVAPTYALLSCSEDNSYRHPALEAMERLQLVPELQSLRKGDIMRISVNYDSGQIFQHFGRTEMFKIYDIEEGKIVKEFLLPADGAGHGALPVQLKANGVETAICGGLDMGMLNALQAAGITVCANVTGDADQAVNDYLAGTLKYNTEAHACHGHHQ